MRAPVFETGGRGFESCLARQSLFHAGVTQLGECGASNPETPVRLRPPVPISPLVFRSSSSARPERPSHKRRVKGSNPFSTINIDVGGHEKSTPSRDHPKANQREFLTSGRISRTLKPKGFKGRGPDINFLGRSQAGKAPDC